MTTTHTLRFIRCNDATVRIDDAPDIPVLVADDREYEYCEGCGENLIQTGHLFKGLTIRCENCHHHYVIKTKTVHRVSR